MERDIFLNLSPWDHRYSLNEEEFNQLSRFFSEKAQILYQVKVEVALTEELGARGICPLAVVEEIKKAAVDIDPAQVYEEEKRTRHNIRALVNVLAGRVSETARPFIHLSATSMDIVDTAASMRYRDAHQEVLRPAVKELLRQLAVLARREKETLQVGRTHGQHAVPITFGFAVAQYLDRLGRCTLEMDKRVSDLRGKMAGAVGAYNAASLICEQPRELEKGIMARLGLQPAPISTQIVPPEFLLHYLHSLIVALGVLADFSDDMRHLQRTEIAEVGEYFDARQVGSSTMPQKQNPINYEHIKSLWKTALPRLLTCYTDQLSEHQRDLTNSASSRFYAEIPISFYLACQRLNRVMVRFSADRDAMRKNLFLNQGMVLAEAMYILLARAGHPHAHEAVRKLLLQARDKGQSLLDAWRAHDELRPYLEQLSDRQKAVFTDPGLYTGQAAAITESILTKWEGFLQENTNG